MKTDVRIATAENRTIGNALLGVALACAVVVYVLSLYIFSDYWLPDSGETAGATARPIGRDDLVDQGLVELGAEGVIGHLKAAATLDCKLHGSLSPSSFCGPSPQA